MRNDNLVDVAVDVAAYSMPSISSLYAGPKEPFVYGLKLQVSSQYFGAQRAFAFFAFLFSNTKYNIYVAWPTPCQH